MYFKSDNTLLTDQEVMFGSIIFQNIKRQNMETAGQKDKGQLNLKPLIINSLNKIMSAVLIIQKWSMNLQPLMQPRIL